MLPAFARVRESEHKDSDSESEENAQKQPEAGRRKHSRLKAERYRYEKFKKSSGSLALAAGMTVQTAGFCMAAQTEQTGESWKATAMWLGIDPGHQGSWVDMSDTEPDGPGSENYKAKSSTGTAGELYGSAGVRTESADFPGSQRGTGKQRIWGNHDQRG